MKFCSKCGIELTDGVCKNCSSGGVNKKSAIIVGSIFLLSIAGFIGFNNYQEKKINEKKELGIEYIKNKKYKEAYVNLGDYLQKKEGDFEILKIQKDLKEIVNIENQIDEKKFDDARDELKNLNMLETTEGKEAKIELDDKLIVKEKEEEERLKALLEEKMEILYGYWVDKWGIWQFKKSDKWQISHPLSMDDIVLNGRLDNVEYDEKTNTVIVREKFDEEQITGHEIGELVEMKIKDKDNIAIEINNYGEDIIAKRVSQKEAVGYMYGKALMNANGEDVYIFGLENFEEMAVKDRSYTSDMAIEFIAKEEKNNKENYEAIEKNILPGYTSYEVTNKVTDEKKYIFEGNLMKKDFKKKYMEYADKAGIQY